MHSLLLALALLQVPAGTPAAPPGVETIVAIQLHGNTITSDDELRRLAAISVGTPLDRDTVEAVTERLRASKRFESVSVLKRFASIADPSQIIVVIFVDEGPVRIERTSDPGNPTRVVRARRRNLMFLPVLSAEDGYGLTYGARLSLQTPAGKGTRIGIPLTWGGDKRAGAEFEKTFTRGPLDRFTAGGSVSQRTNPYYDEDDTRQRVWVRGERTLVPHLRAGATAGFQRVTFIDPAAQSFGHGGVDVTFDTRLDPALPRNAVYAKASWEHIASANIVGLEGRGYVGVIGQTVLEVRAQRRDGDRVLQPFLKPLLGGMNTVRGFEAGTAVGDTLTAASAELWVPITSPLASFGRTGVSIFADTGTVYDDGQRLGDQAWLRGYGGSVWISAAIFRLNLAVAHGHDASTRVHFGLSLLF